MKTHKRCSRFLFVLTLILMTHSVVSADWPQWRGPFLNGSAEEQNLPASWSENQNTAWVVALPGPSGATPVICNGKVYISSAAGSGSDLAALCIDANNGNKLWEKHVGTSSLKLSNNTAASSSPVTDGKIVIFFYGSGHLAAFDTDGNSLWTRNLVDDYGTFSISFGYSSSPLLYQDKLYIVVIRRDVSTRGGGASQPLESYLLAINPATGENIWKQTRPSNTNSESMESYTTPVPFNNNGRIEILNIGSDHITANDPNNGKELWRFEYQTDKVRDSRIVPSLVTIDDLIIGARYKHHGVFALKPSSLDNTIKPELAWELKEPSPDVCTPLYYKNRLYVINDAQGVLACVEPKTGKKIWQNQMNGRGPWRASLTGADDKIFCVNESGDVEVFAAGDDFKVLFETKINETPVRSSIAIANGSLFIRTAQKLYCIRK